MPGPLIPLRALVNSVLEEAVLLSTTISLVGQSPVVELGHSAMAPVLEDAVFVPATISLVGKPPVVEYCRVAHVLPELVTSPSLGPTLVEQLSVVIATPAVRLVALGLPCRSHHPVLAQPRWRELRPRWLMCPVAPTRFAPRWLLRPG